MKRVRGLLTVMLALNVLFIIQAALVNVSGQTFTIFDVDPGDVYGPQPYVLQQVNRQINPLYIAVNVRDPSLFQTVLGLFAHGLAQALAAVPMIIFARRLVDRAIAGDPFTAPMVRGLRRLGALVLLGGFAAELVRLAARSALKVSAIGGDWNPLYDPNPTLGFSWLLLGLVILGFAQVIEHGRALRAELDEVI
jgi:hypothetical protein